MNREELLLKWKEEEAYGFYGWDFTHLYGIWESVILPWVYKTIISAFLKKTDNLLDMGTGGGEFLLSLNHPYRNTYVTEAYEPNVRLCRKNLEPIGITVAHITKDSCLPFQDEMFDVIINRHESFDIDEVKRILKKNGIFITQQVGGKNDSDLSERLCSHFRPQFPEHDLNFNKKLIEKTEFKILQKNEFFGKVKFYDVGALVYFAKIIPWEFPGFQVESAQKILFQLQREVDDIGYIKGTEHRFFIVAQKK